MNVRGFIAGRFVDVGIALTALRTNLMRSILTALGVMIGVFAVILAMAVGSGAKVSVEQTVAQLGSNMAIIFPQQEGGRGGPNSAPGKLTERDAVAIERSIPGVIAIAPQIRANIQLSIPARRVTTSGIAITPGYAIASNTGIESGRMIEESDVRSAARVVVLGPTVATSLFGDVDPTGSTVRLNKVPFRVIGVLASKGRALATTRTTLRWSRSAPGGSASRPR
jgi:putative ABC transport system permease protein